MNRKFTDEQLIETITKVDYLTELLVSLGYIKLTSGAYRTVKAAIIRLGLDTSHFRGRPIDFESKEQNRKRISKEFRLNFIEHHGHFCRECGLAEWRGKPAALEIHHVNGDTSDNDYSNLELICLQCHAQTPNWKGRKRNTLSLEERKERAARNRKTGKCKQCSVPIDREAEHCKKCATRPRKFEISKEELEVLVNNMPMTKIGEMFGVSDNAVKKRAKKLGIELKPMRGYWAKLRALSEKDIIEVS